MPHIFSAQNHQKLDSPERKEILPPEKILGLTMLKPGHVMADVGAGTGYFSIPAAQIVGKDGKVLASDISEDMLNIIRSKLTAENRGIIQLIHSNGVDSGIPDNTVDYMLLCTVLHESQDPQKMLDNLFKSVKQGGRLVLVEWIKRESDKGPPLKERIATDDASEKLKDVGFRRIEEIPFNSEFYILVAEK
jgi:ubiquinone/menaquinone biosynthesis C-methylase UbiE